jgi:hypothetical protein
VIDEELIEVALNSSPGTLEVYAMEICGVYHAVLLVFGSHSLAASKVFFPVFVVVAVMERNAVGVIAVADKAVAVVVVECHFLGLDREHQCRCLEGMPVVHSPTSSHSAHLEKLPFPQ